MSRTSRLALFLCFTPTALLAQIDLRDRPLVPLGTNCPVGMRATVEKSGNLLAAQRVQVTLTQWPPFGIVASRITIHGIAPVANHPEPSEIRESLDLNRIVDYPRSDAFTARRESPAKQGQLAELDDILGPPPGPVFVRRSSPDSRWYAWVISSAAVNSIDLESVSYADGTSWHASNGTPCRVSVQ